jgi:hypothetical protein
VYPGEDILKEVGRVTIAAAQLDLWMATLWVALDPATDETKARRSSGAAQCAAIRLLAQQWHDSAREELLLTVAMAEDARQRRNEIVHQGWLLNGSDVPWPWKAWDESQRRGSTVSVDWQRIPARSFTPEPAQALGDLEMVEQALAEAGQRAFGLGLALVGIKAILDAAQRLAKVPIDELPPA